MEYLVTIDIARSELKEYKDYIGFLFKNENGVYNICDTEEDIMKSNQWFNNLPKFSLVVNEEEIQIGDKFLAICVNKELNEKIFTYLGPHEELIDCVKLIGKDGEHTSTKHILDGAYKFVRKSNRTDKEKLINGTFTHLFTK